MGSGNLLCTLLSFFLYGCAPVWLYLKACVWVSENPGGGDEESAGEEYEIGEYVLEDLEPGSTEEAGFFVFDF